jgi:hypothetical protein
MITALCHDIQRLGQRLMRAATAPSSARVVVDTVADLPRSKGELIAENALLRQQLVVLQRGVKRVHCTPTDRTLLVLLASRVRAWRQALLIVQPATLLRWHRQGFRRASACSGAGNPGRPRPQPGPWWLPRRSP